MSTTTTALIELRCHYEGIIAQAEYQSAQAKAQLEHIDTLLVNGLLTASPGNTCPQTSDRISSTTSTSHSSGIHHTVITPNPNSPVKLMRKLLLPTLARVSRANATGSDRPNLPSPSRPASNDG